MGTRKTKQKTVPQKGNKKEKYKDPDTHRETIRLLVSNILHASFCIVKVKQPSEVTQSRRRGTLSKLIKLQTQHLLYYDLVKLIWLMWFLLILLQTTAAADELKDAKSLQRSV